MEQENNVRQAILPARTNTRFWLKKLFRLSMRLGLYVFTGMVAWVAFDPLPPDFLWGSIFTLLSAMSLHTVLFRRPGSSAIAKLACRYAFFFSIPMLFVFAGNRAAVWATNVADTAQLTTKTNIDVAQGVLPAEEYQMLKDLKKTGIKDPGKVKKGFKSLLGKHLKKAKEMDKATRTLFIILGFVLLLVVLVLVALLVGVNQTVNSCGGNDNDDDDGCLNGGCIS